MSEVRSSSLENISSGHVAVSLGRPCKEEPVGREIKHEIYARSREFLSDETKLE